MAGRVGEDRHSIASWLYFDIVYPSLCFQIACSAFGRLSSVLAYRFAYCICVSTCRRSTSRKSTYPATLLVKQTGRQVFDTVAMDTTILHLYIVRSSKSLAAVATKEYTSSTIHSSPRPLPTPHSVRVHECEHWGIVIPSFKFRSLSNRPQYGSTPPNWAFQGSSNASTGFPHVSASHLEESMSGKKMLTEKVIRPIGVGGADEGVEERLQVGDRRVAL